MLKAIQDFLRLEAASGILLVGAAVLALVVTVLLGFGGAQAARLTLGGDVTAYGVLQAAGLMFFAFAGYALFTIAS